MSGLSIEQAAKITGKSRATIFRWQKAGIDVTNRESLLEYNDFMDSRSRGDSRKKVAHRLDALSDQKEAEQPALIPFDEAISTTETILERLHGILAEAKAAGNEFQVFLAEEDVKLAESALKSLTALAGGFEE